jgi:hypothetical protein
MSVARVAEATPLTHFLIFIVVLPARILYPPRTLSRASGMPQRRYQ